MQLLYCHCVSASLIRVLPSGNKSCALKAQIAVAGFTSNLVKSCQHLHSCTSPHSGLKSEMFSFCDNPGVCLIRSPEVLCSHTWHPIYMAPHMHGTPHAWHPIRMASHTPGTPHTWHPTHDTPHTWHPTHVAPHTHGIPHTWYPIHIAPHIHGIPHTWHPTHGTPHTWHPTRMAPPTHDTPHTWHPTHGTPHTWHPTRMVPHTHDTPHTWYAFQSCLFPQPAAPACLIG